MLVGPPGVHPCSDNFVEVTGAALYVDEAPTVLEQVADLVDAHEWSRLGGSLGEQVAQKLADAGLLKEGA